MSVNALYFIIDDQRVKDRMFNDKKGIEHRHKAS